MTPEEEFAEGMRGLLDGAAALVLIVGAYNGLGPFVGRWMLRSDPILVLPLRLRSPWWWIAALTVTIVTVGLLALIESGRRHWNTPHRDAGNDVRRGSTCR